MSDGGRTQKMGTGPEPLVQSGTFTIAYGSIVDPALIEPESSGDRPVAVAAEAADLDDSDKANP